MFGVYFLCRRLLPTWCHCFNLCSTICQFLDFFNRPICLASRTKWWFLCGLGEDALSIVCENVNIVACEHFVHFMFLSIHFVLYIDSLNCTCGYVKARWCCAMKPINGKIFMP